MKMSFYHTMPLGCGKNDQSMKAMRYFTTQDCWCSFSVAWITNHLCHCKYAHAHAHVHAIAQLCNSMQVIITAALLSAKVV